MDEAEIQSIVRPTSVAVSWRAKKALKLAFKLCGATSADALADKLVLGWFEHNCPQVLEFLDKQAAAEREFQQNLKKKENTV